MRIAGEQSGRSILCNCNHDKYKSKNHPTIGAKDTDEDEIRVATEYVSDPLDRPALLRLSKEGELANMMTTYEALMLTISFGALIVAILSFAHRK
ncbi:putative holin-like toxin [Gracilibacillus salinarum]|uniref:Holin-like toxin n=1 Tax=Gracilibacillus salinarum TaxID=2932255 RepID=A0ABY4GHC4_9BACI|nr:putative holin-like toxin [Gracilibacillus salinarum]UOQ83610.1 putative holin-like toxin [Gracilibacillus salinarum]